MRSKHTVQPYITCVTGRKVSSYFIQGDGHIVQIEKKANGINAFDLLFKFHFVFNIHFANSLKYFYNFMEYYLYKTTTTALGSVTSLMISLENK